MVCTKIKRDKPYEIPLSEKEKTQKDRALTIIALATIVALFALGAVIIGGIGITGTIWTHSPHWIQLVNEALSFWGGIGAAGGGSGVGLMALGCMIGGIYTKPKHKKIFTELWKDYKILWLKENYPYEDALLKDKECFLTRDPNTKQLRLHSRNDSVEEKILHCNLSSLEYAQEIIRFQQFTLIQLDQSQIKQSEFY